MDSGSSASPLAAKPSWAKWLLLISIVLLIAAVVLPPLFNISRYKRRIATSISSSIGRPVHMSTVRLHLLPVPGFEISDFEVEEDPAFGDEPMLRSANVIASIRLSSLWRGRLEIGRISFDEPSLNLARDGQGHWNFDSILVKASQSEIAPTVQSRPGATLRFPYIAARNARINFKQGYEKQPLSFLNADVSIWLDQPGQWRLRFEAQPVRTDLDLALSDTGLVRMDGTFHRATELQQVGMVLHAEWVKAPLGQLSRLLAGRDMGWRGDLDVRADITGTAANAQIKARIRANGVHRLEFAPLEPLDMDATCQGSYLDGTSSLEGLACTSPIGNGKLMLAGSVHALSTQPQPDVQLHMEKVPVSALLESIRSIRSDFAPSLRARGTVDGDFRFGPQEGYADAILDGSATVNALELAMPDLEKPLLIPQIKLATTDGKPVEEPHPAHRGHRKLQAAAPAVLEPALLLKPFALTGTGASPLMADGRFTAKNFSFHLAGEAPIKDLTAIGKNFGFLASALAPLARQGEAAIDLTIHGPWLVPVSDVDHPVAVDTAEGTLQLRNARIASGFLPAPVDVASATATFSEDQVSWTPFSFTYAGISGEGALRYRIPCHLEKGCGAEFALRFPALDATHVEAALLGGSEREGKLKDLLARIDGRTSLPWPAMKGTVEAGTLTLSEMAVHDVRATLVIDGNHVQISSLDGHALGGTLHASGALDATGGKPHYAADVELTRTNAAEIAPLFHEKWGSGTLSLNTHFDVTGYTDNEFESSARGSYRWDWTRGSFFADGSSPLSRFDRFQAEGAIANQQLTIEHSTLTRGGQSVAASGSISFDRALKLSLSEDGSTSLVTGTLQKPVLEPTAAKPVKHSSRTSP
ncbi:MAG TPA: AsmA family protein [Acidisarcina sp.]|nr:AsmA family protein [Acidisarcina sp.]